MTLPKEQYSEFMFAQHNLLYFIAIENKIISEKTSFSEFVKMDYSIKLDARNILIENLEQIDNLIIDMHDQLTTNDKTFLENMKNSLYSEFVIFKCLPSHAIFMDTITNKFYEVRALGQAFDKLLPEIPIAIKTVLLQFESFIVYDGFLIKQNKIFDRATKKQMNADYQEAKKNRSIITKLN
jgi:hypothetical protein